MAVADAPSRPVREATDGPPLCVDLDGTLILSDLLFESFLLLVRQAPLALLLVPIWLLRGKAVLKAEIAARVVFCVRTLPYNVELIRWLQAERETGRRLWLCTAANEVLAASVAQHLQLFDGVLASDRCVNLSGTRKAALLVERFGERGFDYCGNERCDIDVWKRANGAIVVNSHHGLPDEVARHAQVLRTFPRRRLSGLPPLVGALRLQRWVENWLVFVPPLVLGRLEDINGIVATLLAFIALCLCSSSVGIAGDLVNVEAARRDPIESANPLGTGELSIFSGLLLVPALLCGAIAASLLLPRYFWLVLVAFGLVMATHDLAGRRRVNVGVLASAALNASRLLAGATAISMSL